MFFRIRGLASGVEVRSRRAAVNNEINSGHYVVEEKAQKNVTRCVCDTHAHTYTHTHTHAHTHTHTHKQRQNQRLRDVNVREGTAGRHRA